jgi:capsular polysaccharide transport system permease protein
MPAGSALSGTGGFRRALATQIRVIGALSVRDALARYGHENLGFFWVIGEPLMLSTGVLTIWTILNYTHGSGVGVVPFALSGYSLVQLWRMTIFKSMHVMRQNIGLIFHTNVKFFDILVARALLDTLGILTSFFIAYIPLMVLGITDPINDYMVLLGGWFLTAWFSFSVGLIIAALTEISEAAERFIHPVMYLTLPLTGTFYMVYWLPGKAKDLVLWSPLVNGSEMFRSALLPPDIPTQWDALYMFWWCVALTAIGLPFVLYAQRHVRFE